MGYRERLAVRLIGWLLAVPIAATPDPSPEERLAQIRPLMAQDPEAALEQIDEAVAACGECEALGTLTCERGRALILLGRHAEAKSALERAWTLALAAGDDPLTLLVHVSFVKHYLDQANFESARGHSTAGRRLALHLEDWPSVLKLDINAAAAALMQGDTEAAAAAMSVAWELAREHDLRAFQGAIGQNLAELLIARGQLAEAVPVYQGVVEFARREGLRTSEAWTLVGLGWLHLRLGQWNDARARLQESLAVEELADNPTVLHLAEFGLGRAARRRGAPETAHTHFGRAAAVLEGLRGSIVGELARISFLDARANLFDEWIDLLLTLDRPDAALAVAELGRSRSWIDARRERDPESIDATAVLPDVAAVRAQARRLDATVVDYWLAPDYLAVWVIDPDGTIEVHREVGDTAPLVATVERVAERLAQGASDPTIAAPLRELHRRLIAPLAELLPTDSEALVVVMPHRALHRVPFAALTGADGAPLVDRHTIARLPALALAPETPSELERPVRALVLADPVAPEFTGLPRLPAAATEARRIGQLGAGWQVRTLRGAAASETALKRGASEHDVLHLAAHSRSDDARPLGSYVALSATDSDDGLLRAEEILSLQVSARLVVLSSCSSASGRLTGDGVIGLTRSFLQAGADVVVATLWDVEDASAAAIVGGLYDGLSSGRSAPHALRRAQREDRRRGAPVRQWAPYVTVMGDVDGR